MLLLTLVLILFNTLCVLFKSNTKRVTKKILLEKLNFFYKLLKHYFLQNGIKYIFLKIYKRCLYALKFFQIKVVFCMNDCIKSVSDYM